MRFFTPELVLQLNSPDGDHVDRAMQQWERATEAYQKHLEKIRGATPGGALPIDEVSLHDWDLVDISNRGKTASIVLRQNENLIVLRYSLSSRLQIVQSPKEWFLSKERVQWLYDELDADEKQPASFVHRVLLSDGATLIVPFSKCEVATVKLNRAMSHSDVMQIA